MNFIILNYVWLQLLATLHWQRRKFTCCFSAGLFDDFDEIRCGSYVPK